MEENSLFEDLRCLQPEGDGERLPAVEAAGHLREVRRIVAGKAEGVADLARDEGVGGRCRSRVFRIGEVCELMIHFKPVERIMSDQAGNLWFQVGTGEPLAERGLA